MQPVEPSPSEAIRILNRSITVLLIITVGATGPRQYLPKTCFENK